MDRILDYVLDRLAVEPGVLVVYLLLYWAAGFANDAVGRRFRIAWFPRRWYVLTCYGLYMVPCSLYVRELHWFDQYLYGLFFLAILEFTGYCFKKESIADHNLLDRLFSRANFALAMVIYFAAYLPVGNWAVATLYEMLFS